MSRSEHDILGRTIYLKCTRTAVSETMGCVSHSLAVGLFVMGFPIEAAAVWLFESHKQNGDNGLLKEGAWSIVRHPKRPYSLQSA